MSVALMEFALGAPIYPRLSKYESLEELISYIKRCCEVAGWEQYAGAFLSDRHGKYYAIVDENFDLVLLNSYGLPHTIERLRKETVS